MGIRDETASASSRGNHTVVAVKCAQCGTLSSGYWVGWRAYRNDEPEFDEPPALAFFCLACAKQEFGV
jgi:hypothetical protein